MNEDVWRWALACAVGLVCNLNALAAPGETLAETMRYRIEFATLLGGSEYDDLREVIPLPDGSLLLGGQTTSADFPTTPGVVGSSTKGDHEAFILKLKGDGSGLVWSTRLGGRAADGIMAVQVDAAGTVYVAGHTQSDDFPVTGGAPQVKLGGKSDGVFAILSPDGSRLLHATYVGGGEEDLLRSLAISAMRAFTSLRTSATGSGLSAGKRIVPLLVS